MLDLVYFYYRWVCVKLSSRRRRLHFLAHVREGGKSMSTICSNVNKNDKIHYRSRFAS
jgi:hypothetical protein